MSKIKMPYKFEVSGEIEYEVENCNNASGFMMYYLIDSENKKYLMECKKQLCKSILNEDHHGKIRVKDIKE